MGPGGSNPAGAAFGRNDMDQQLAALLDPLKAYGFTPEVLMLANAMKNMKATGYGNVITLPINPGETGSAPYKISRAQFAWTQLFYCLVPENTGLNFDFSIDVVYNQDRRSFKSPIPPPAYYYGNPRVWLWRRNNPCVVFDGESTVNVTLTNNFAAPLVTPLRVWVGLVGNEDKTV
jgi:hypothetical protein